MSLFAQSIYWEAPVLLVIFSLVYSATRHDRWDRILWEAAGWTFRVGGFLLIVGVSLYVLSSYPDYWIHLTVVGGILTLIYWGLLRYWHRQQQLKATAKP